MAGHQFSSRLCQRRVLGVLGALADVLTWCNRRQKAAAASRAAAFTNCELGVLEPFNITWGRLAAPDAFGLGRC